ncbi:DUF6879 family protein [Streptomyces sp. NPDC093984]|uniref:DUF6879 family protein n=1 Tax=Streptomyces sp. NPDC093984 TaxID=3366052 RepID=UPI00380AF52C
MTGASGASSGEARRTSRSEEGQRSPNLLRKTLVTAVVAGATYFLTNVLNQDKNGVWQLTVSVVLGGAALIIQYLVDFEQRLNSMEQGLDKYHLEMRREVEGAFVRISEATELFSEVDRSVLRSDGVARLARAYTHVGRQESQLVKDFAQDRIAQLASTMESLSRGSTDCPGEEHDWLIALTACCARTLEATSTPVDRDFWTSEPANRYLKAQEEAVKRGVRVRRLFLVKNPLERTEELEDLCRSQRDLGIDARIAVRSELPQRARLTLTNDFIVFDGQLCYEIEPDVDVVPAKTLLKMTPEHVQERMKRFNVLWEATEPTGPDPLPAPTAASG